MVIRIKSEGTRIFLPIPTMWVFSGTGLFFFKKLDKDESFKGLKPKHMRNIRTQWPFLMQDSSACRPKAVGAWLPTCPLLSSLSLPSLPPHMAQA